MENINVGNGKQTLRYRITCTYFRGLHETIRIDFDFSFSLFRVLHIFVWNIFRFVSFAVLYSPCDVCEIYKRQRKEGHIKSVRWFFIQNRTVDVVVWYRRFSASLFASEKNVSYSWCIFLPAASVPFFIIQLQVCFQPFFSVRLYSLVPFFFLSFRSLHFCWVPHSSLSRLFVCCVCALVTLPFRPF